MAEDHDQKHIAFFKLMDAIKSGECAVCYQLRKRMQQYFETLLYENVNNREFRAELRAAGGFCSAHAHQLAHYKDGLALAVMHLELLEAALRRTTSPPGRCSEPAATLATARNRRKAAADQCVCPACRVAQQQTAASLDRITRYAADPEFLAAWRRSSGLCVPHYALLLQRDAGPPAEFVEHQRGRLQALADRTRRFIDAQNATAGDRPVLSGEERTVWKQIIDRYYGQPGALP
ncbi:MAG: hypothetical protein EA384_06620 [Spirochaetaceae bacterium]|nr:MAG: hypothetical protein EA384_06620 [Spirochaetaceae bacterium]